MQEALRAGTDARHRIEQVSGGGAVMSFAVAKSTATPAIEERFPHRHRIVKASEVICVAVDSVTDPE